MDRYLHVRCVSISPGREISCALLIDVVEQLLEEVERLATRQAATEAHLLHLTAGLKIPNAEPAHASGLRTEESLIGLDRVLRECTEANTEECSAAGTNREREPGPRYR